MLCSECAGGSMQNSSSRGCADLLQPSMKGCNTAISDACAASSTNTFSKAFSSLLKMRRPVLDKVVKTISASCTKESSKFSDTCSAQCHTAWLVDVNMCKLSFAHSSLTLY